MEVTISLPEDISESLRGRWGNVSRHALETIAVEGYRTGALSETQVRLAEAGCQVQPSHCRLLQNIA